LLTGQWKTENNIPSITWPAQSPDINLTENSWKVIKRCVQQNIANIENRQDLIACAMKYREIPGNFTQHAKCNLFKSNSM